MNGAEQGGQAEERATVRGDEGDGQARPRRRKDSLPSARHRARILTLQALYEADQTGHDPASSIERLLLEDGTAPETIGYARRLVQGIKARREEIDRHIAAAATQWPVEELAVVDRNILRIAIYEMLLDAETPVGVAVNEAVELAKAFGSDASSRFVNGVLGALSVLAGSGNDGGEKRTQG